MLKKILFTLLCYSFALPNGQAQDQIRLSVQEYDEETAHEEKEDPVWTIMDLRADNQTTYRLIEDEQGNPVIRAESINAAAGLIHGVDIDPEEYPIIEWSWKVDRVLENGDLRKKSGDDYPARIYITFDYDPSNLGFMDKVKYRAIRTFTRYKIPLRAINYIWANQADVGTIAKNPYTNWVQMVAVQSGDRQTGTWITERRNLLEDFRTAFGEDPPRITGVAIMTDTDNTGEEATGWYGDITFKKKVESDESISIRLR